MRPVVLLDVDGPLCNFTQGYLDAFEYETGAKHTTSEVDRWSIADCDFFKKAACDLNIEHRALKAKVDAHVSDPGFCDELKVQPGAQQAVAALSDLADVYAVTSPWDSSPTWMYERHHWLVRHFKIPRARILHTQTKHLVRGHVFLDDKPSHVEAWAAAWPDAHALLFDMPHNRDAPKELRRATWSDLIDIVRCL